MPWNRLKYLFSDTGSIAFLSQYKVYIPMGYNMTIFDWFLTYKEH